LISSQKMTQPTFLLIMIFTLLSFQTQVTASVPWTCYLTITKIVSPTYNLNAAIQKDPLNLNQVLLDFNQLMAALKTPNSACDLNQDVSPITITNAVLANQTCLNAVISFRPNFQDINHQLNLLNLSYFQQNSASILGIFNKFKQSCKA